MCHAGWGSFLVAPRHTLSRSFGCTGGMNPSGERKEYPRSKCLILRHPRQFVRSAAWGSVGPPAEEMCSTLSNKFRPVAERDLPLPVQSIADPDQPSVRQGGGP